VLALEVNRAQNADAATENGWAWLAANQDKSPEPRQPCRGTRIPDPKSNAGPFGSGAATAYAALTLEGRR
jgi:hypothetical protein